MDSGSATPSLSYDVHVHSDYSDGTAMADMVETAREVGLGVESRPDPVGCRGSRRVDANGDRLRNESDSQVL